MTAYYLGVDNGGTATKAALFNQNGEEIAVATRKVCSLQPHTGWSERDMDTMWADTTAVIREVLEKSRVPSEAIACVGCTGHGNGLYLIDNAGRPVRNAINSDDNRAADIINKWQSDGLHQKVLPKTMQSLWAAQPNALLCWLSEHEPEALSRASWMLMAKDYTRFKLTSKVHGELSDMSALSLMDNRKCQWDEELLRTWGIEFANRLLPPIVRSTEIVGQVTAVAAEQCGLAIGTPVCAGAFDIDACGLAAGMVDSGQLCMVAGTWGNHLFVSREPVIRSELFMCSRYVIDDYFLHLEGSPSSAGNLEWFISNILLIESSIQSQSPYKQCQKIFSMSDKENDLLFLPFISGSPAGLNATGGFLGIRSHHNRSDMLRAVYESVAFSHRWQLERLLRFATNLESNVVLMTGGVTKDPDWVQLFADCLDRTIEVPSGSELGAKGAAIISSVAIGHHATLLDACSQMVRYEAKYQPQQAHRNYLESKYDRFCKLIMCLEPFWNNRDRCSLFNG